MGDLIAAIATARGRGGIAVVRVSGEGALALARAMFSRKGEYTPNMLYTGTIDCGDFTDFGMCVYFRAPRSFTGEDTVEFHCHGGTEIARGVLSRALTLGARLAEAGEFTKRAYLNGKLSLSAVEGMGEMIGAESAAQVRAGYALYTEALNAEIVRLQTAIKECLAGVDAEVDYPEEDLSAGNRAQTRSALREILSSLRALSERYRTGKKIRSGVKVALCGRPNAGKSSLLNALLGYDRAIVSAIPGTTRDLVEGTIEIRGVLFRLTDTAGLREGADEIEREGVRRAEQAIGSSDVIVYLKEDEAFDLPFPQGVPVITVGAKSDLGIKEGCEIALSSLTGEGIPALKERLYEVGFGAEQEGVYLLEERQFEAVSEALGAALAAQEGVLGGSPAELYAEDLKRAYAALGRISGETATEEIIEEIFSKFCVGK